MRTGYEGRVRAAVGAGVGAGVKVGVRAGVRTGYEGRCEDWGGGRGEGQHFPSCCSPILLPARPGSLPFSSVGTGAFI